MNVIVRCSLKACVKRSVAREPIHVARDRQAEEIQQRWRNVNHCTATLTRCDDRRPVGEQEPVRSSLVCAAELRVAGDAFQHTFANGERLHPET